MKPKLPIALTNLQKTLLITLRGKALESQFEDSVLQDQYAAEIIDQLDYDFSNMHLTHDAIVSLAVRAKVLDLWAEQFLNTHTQANIVHLGCGLDSRILRLNPPPEVQWWEIDFPEVIALRKEVYQERPGCTMLGHSILDDRWTEAIPPDLPTLVLAEGVFPYFQVADGERLLRSIVGHFERGQIAFDAYNGWGVAWLNQLSIMRQAHERLNWVVNDPKQLEIAVPGLRLIEENNDGLPGQDKRVSWLARTGFRISRLFKSLRRMGQLLLFEFGG